MTGHGPPMRRRAGVPLIPSRRSGVHPLPSPAVATPMTVSPGAGRARPQPVSQVSTVLTCSGAGPSPSAHCRMGKAPGDHVAQPVLARGLEPGVGFVEVAPVRRHRGDDELVALQHLPVEPAEVDHGVLTLRWDADQAAHASRRGLLQRRDGEAGVAGALEADVEDLPPPSRHSAAPDGTLGGPGWLPGGREGTAGIRRVWPAFTRPPPN